MAWHDLYSPPWNAAQVLDGVELWAANSYLLRETGVLGDGCRLDGLLIPVSWNSPIATGIHGVEVKISRSDFLRGLRGGQLEKYLSKCNTLYIATGPKVCKTSEIPKSIGHLIVGRRDGQSVCVCRRHATFHPGKFSEKFMWRMVFDLFDQFEKQRRKEESERREKDDIVGHEIWRRVATAAEKAISEIRNATPKITEEISNGNG